VSVKRISASTILTAVVVVTVLLIVFWMQTSDRSETRNSAAEKARSAAPSGSVVSRITSPMMPVQQVDALGGGPSDMKLKAFRDSEYSKNKPISVYGRIIDQHDQPVPGVTLRVGLAYVPYLVVPGFGWSSTTVNVVSDENGEFSIENQTGVYLAFDAAEKSGYQFGNVDNYAVYGDSSKNASTPTNRLIIHAWNVEAPKTRVKIDSVAVTFRPNGEFVSIDFDKKYGEDDVKSGPPDGDLYVAILAGPRDANGYFDWTATLRAVGGGVQEHSRAERFPYLAPETGYVPEWTKTIQHDRNGFLDARFYVTSRSGKRYSEIAVHFDPTWREGKGLVSLHYVTNLDGEREVPRALIGQR